MSVQHEQLKELEDFFIDHFQDQELRYRDTEIFYKTTAQIHDKDADEIKDPYVQFYHYLEQI